ncbi:MULTISPECIES: PIN domain-containing protein [unclassified Streptomyces]|uniref:PIN domain-containing protein n=1 Tax=unclassified Streptomyces TaxID=2593676 RepID=UPI000BF09AE8|nr:MULTISPECIES: PIN domain-containing protein [unclassified Streptomyces]
MSIVIILDTCVIRSLKLDGSEAQLLRAIRDTEAERIGVPWMVMEERAAQLAIKYRETYCKADQALEQLRAISPGSVPDLAEPDEEAVREQFRDQLRELAVILPTTEAALREGVVRESNALPPAGTKKGEKVGARDVAIWLSAVEYARNNPSETIYFVSSNTRDFTAGDGPYPPPMDADIEGLGDRFVHLPQLADLLKVVAPPLTVSPDLVQSLLPSSIAHFRTAMMVQWGSVSEAIFTPFPVLSQAAGTVKEAIGWMGPRGAVRLTVLQVTDVQGYVLGDQDWCIASVRWQVVGLAQFTGGVGVGCCTWTTRILMPLVEGGPSPRILHASPPEAPSDVQSIDWGPSRPAIDLTNPDSATLRDFLESGSKLERAFAVFLHALGNVAPDKWPEEARAAMEADRSAATGIAEATDGDDDPGGPS